MLQVPANVLLLILLLVHVLVSNLPGATLESLWKIIIGENKMATYLYIYINLRRSRDYQVVSPPLGWSPLTSFLVIWSPSGDARGS